MKKMLVLSILLVLGMAPSCNGFLDKELPVFAPCFHPTLRIQQGGIVEAIRRSDHTDQKESNEGVAIPKPRHPQEPCHPGQDTPHRFGQQQQGNGPPGRHLPPLPGLQQEDGEHQGQVAGEVTFIAHHPYHIVPLAWTGAVQKLVEIEHLQHTVGENEYPYSGDPSEDSSNSLSGPILQGHLVEHRHAHDVPHWHEKH